MSRKICRVIGRWRGADASIAEVVLDGDEADISERFAAVDALPPPRQAQGMYLELDTGERVDMPVPADVRILPGQQTVAAIFTKKSADSPNQMGISQRSDNAAIFDLHGKLVDVLHNPEGPGSSFIGFNGSSFNAVSGVGEVWIAVRSDEPQDYFLSIYRIDGQHHCLEKSTRRQIPV